VLTVSKGLAINGRGGQLLLADDTDVTLVRPAAASSAPAQIFQDCKPVTSGVYIAGAGVYMLTIGPASSPQGSAQANGIGTVAASCNSDYNAYGVQFRLLQVDQTMGLTQAQLADRNHLQNLVAYKCFGVDSWNSIWTDPLGSPVEQFGFVDTLRSNQALTDCEVPLAVMYWTADQGILFVDMWPVRRPVVAPGASDQQPISSGQRRTAEGLAMLLQFQSQIANLPSTLTGTVAATDYFSYLPPLGFLPVRNGKIPNGFDYLQFFINRTYPPPAYLEGARLSALVVQSMLYPPIDLGAEEMLWLYSVRENQQAIDHALTNPPQLYFAFTNGKIPFQGEAQFDLNYWNYATFA